MKLPQFFFFYILGLLVDCGGFFFFLKRENNIMYVLNSGGRNIFIFQGCSLVVVDFCGFFFLWKRKVHILGLLVGCGGVLWAFILLEREDNIETSEKLFVLETRMKLLYSCHHFFAPPAGVAAA